MFTVRIPQVMPTLAAGIVFTVMCAVQSPARAAGLEEAMNGLANTIALYLDEKGEDSLIVGPFDGPSGTSAGPVITKVLKEKLAAKNITIKDAGAMKISGSYEASLKDRKLTVSIKVRMRESGALGQEVGEFNSRGVAATVDDTADIATVLAGVFDSTVPDSTDENPPAADPTNPANTATAGASANPASSNPANPAANPPANPPANPANPPANPANPPANAANPPDSGNPPANAGTPPANAAGGGSPQVAAQTPPQDTTADIVAGLTKPGFFLDPANKSVVAAKEGSPYRIEILVKPRGGQFAPGQIIDEDGTAFCQLGLEDEYEIKVYNFSKFDAGVQLTIDGLNVLEFSDIAAYRPHLVELKDPRGRVIRTAKRGGLLMVPAGGVYHVRGWHRNNQEALRFVVTHLPDSAVARSQQQKLGDAKLKVVDSAGVGTITAVFFAAWPVGQNPPPIEPAGARGDTATGIGPPIRQNLQNVIMNFGKTPLAAVSLHYVKPSPADLPEDIVQRDGTVNLQP